MTLEKALEHFRTVKRVAAELGVSESRVYSWKGKVVPEKHAIRLYNKSRGAIQIDPEDYAQGLSYDDPATGAAS